ncbi:nuclear transport factor 2 family protein [Streptomyces sp. MBT53]|uniref:nuclear transport factor 2 family protein n=1 Tax=Streptomyces sp. MBT53 TaxID=1488384 RepID=UPI001913612A|nr:nuclear transport factor 2 family protein [Streptomyces sp. MBT53]MBK6014402.1 nuclear transport factor 2 family protein [Streptomyces sp. MBT53]
MTTDAEAGTTAAIALFERWTALWNGDFSDPESFLAADFRIRFGSRPEGAPDTDGLRGPSGIVDLIARHRAESPGRRYAVEGVPVVDEGRGRVASCWYVTRADGSQKSGIDLLEVVDGRIATVWSVTGVRRFAV